MSTVPARDAGIRAGQMSVPEAAARPGPRAMLPFIEFCQSRNEPSPRAHATDPFRDRLGQAGYGDTVTVMQNNEKISVSR